MISDAARVAHYEDLGFRIQTDKDLAALVERAFGEGTRIEVRRGGYVMWAPGSGIELWVRVDGESKIVGCTPHFSGASRVTLDIERPRKDGRSTEPGGTLSCYTCPTEGGFEEDTSVPVIADSPDFDSIRFPFRRPLRVKAQVAAFAHDLRTFGNEADYNEDQRVELPSPERGPARAEANRLARKIDRATRAPESYFPMGTFSQPMTSTAGFAGHIRQSSLSINPVTRHGFHHLLVKSYGGIVVDLVAAPGIVRGTPVVGGIAEAVGCFSVRVLPAT